MGGTACTAAERGPRRPCGGPLVCDLQSALRIALTGLRLGRRSFATGHVADIMPHLPHTAFVVKTKRGHNRGFGMLTAEHCLRRAERFRLKMLTTNEPLSRARLRDIADNYRRLAEQIPAQQAVRAVETAPVRGEDTKIVETKKAG